MKLLSIEMPERTLRARIVAQLEPTEQIRLYNLAQASAVTAFYDLIGYPLNRNIAFSTRKYNFDFPDGVVLTSRSITPPGLNTILLGLLTRDSGEITDLGHKIDLINPDGSVGERVFNGLLTHSPEGIVSPSEVATMEAAADILAVACVESGIGLR